MANEKKSNSKKKEVVKKKKVPKKNKIKAFFSSQLFLEIVFVALLILVIVLGILVYEKQPKKTTEKSANIVIPISKLESRHSFNINAFNLMEEKEYIFKVTNYKGSQVNQEDYAYQITVQNPTTATIMVTKNDDKTDLMLDQNATVIDGNLKAGKKQEDYYRISVVSSGVVQKEELISVVVTS